MHLNTRKQGLRECKHFIALYSCCMSTILSFLSKDWGKTVQWNINELLHITSANIAMVCVLWEVWSPVSRSSSHYRPPDSCMCGVISKLFPFPSPPATNLLPSSLLTTREMSSHCRLSEGKDWPWRQVPPLKRRLHQIFLQHTRFQKSIFPPLMVLYLSGSYSTAQDTQITVKFTVRQHKHFFISLSMHGFMNMNIQMFIWIFTKYRSVSQPLLFSSFFSHTH